MTVVTIIKDNSSAACGTRSGGGWGRRRWCGTVASSATIACVPCNEVINPPQLDAPPFNIEAVAGIPLIDLTPPAADDANQQPQELESPDPRNPLADTVLPTRLPLL